MFSARRGPKSVSIWLLPTQRMEGWEAFGDEALPGFGGFAAAEDEDEAAFFGFSGGHAHLHQAFLAEGVLRGGLGCPVAADEDRAVGTVGADELAIVVEWDGGALVVEFQQQGVQLLQTAEFVRAGEAGEAQDGRHRAVDDDLIADRRRIGAALWWRGGGCRGGHKGGPGGRSGGLDADAGDGAGCGVDIPRTGIGDDHAGAGWECGGGGGGEDTGFALDQAAAAGVPACMAAFHESVQEIDHQGGGNAGAGFGPVPQQVGEVADRRVGLFVAGDLAWGGRGGDAGALADQQGGDDAGVWRFGRREFEDDALPLFFRRRCGQRVEEGLLFGFA